MSEVYRLHVNGVSHDVADAWLGGNLLYVLRERLGLLRSRKMLAWGFGTPLGLAFLVPFVAVFLMPGAVAGATLLARELLGEETAGKDGAPRETAAAPDGPAPGAEVAYRP